MAWSKQTPFFYDYNLHWHQQIFNTIDALWSEQVKKLKELFLSSKIKMTLYFALERPTMATDGCCGGSNMMVIVLLLDVITPTN